MPFHALVNEFVENGVDTSLPANKCKLVYEYAKDKVQTEAGSANWIAIGSGCDRIQEFFGLRALIAEEYVDSRACSDDAPKHAMISFFHRAAMNNVDRKGNPFCMMGDFTSWGPTTWTVWTHTTSNALASLHRYHPKLLLWDIAQPDLLEALALKLQSDRKSACHLSHLYFNVRQSEMEGMVSHVQPLLDLGCYGSRPIIVDWQEIEAHYYQALSSRTNRSSISRDDTEANLDYQHVMGKNAESDSTDMVLTTSAQDNSDMASLVNGLSSLLSEISPRHRDALSSLTIGLKRPDPQQMASCINEKQSECSICMEATVDAVIYTCGHMTMCYKCAVRIKNEGRTCPICRKRIKDVIKTFKS